MDGRIVACMSGWVAALDRYMLDGWLMKGWMMDRRWMDGWVDLWMDGNRKP